MFHTILPPAIQNISYFENLDLTCALSKSQAPPFWQSQSMTGTSKIAAAPIESLTKTEVLVLLSPSGVHINVTIFTVPSLGSVVVDVGKCDVVVDRLWIFSLVTVSIPLISLTLTVRGVAVPTMALFTGLVVNSGALLAEELKIVKK